MPSIKMKAKPSTGGLREKHGLHRCQKSSMISKNPLSRTKVSQSTGLQTYNQSSSQDASDYDKSHGEDVRKYEVDSDEWAYDEKLLLKHRLSLTDSAAPDDMESPAATCTSGTETAFPPIMESMDAYRNEGSENPTMLQLDYEDSNGSCRSSCEYPECSVADFCISDILFSGPTTGSNTVFDNRTDSIFLSDSECEQSSLLCDFSEEFMVLPFLEDSLDTGHDHDRISLEETITNADDSSFFTAINQLRPSNQESHIPEPDYEYFDPQIYIRNIPDQQETALNSLPTFVPNGKRKSKQITLVLDLDETLVHSTLDHCLDADFTFPVFFNMREQSVYVKQRPHLQTFLERVAEMFEIVVFTASQSFYAKQLLDILDPEGKIISRRAYRESCIFSEGSYVKDLTVLGVDLAKVAIVDNSPQVFSLQVNNGIPIKSWFDDPSDCALLSLLPFLETLADADDVRPIIARKFGNKE